MIVLGCGGWPQAVRKKRKPTKTIPSDPRMRSLSSEQPSALSFSVRTSTISLAADWRMWKPSPLVLIVERQTLFFDATS
jgi:hypothetical protein